MIAPPPSSTLFPYTTLFRSLRAAGPLLTTSANRHGEPPALDAAAAGALPGVAGVLDGGRSPGGEPSTVISLLPGDRKSTRLNSSHRCISYAVFCLKKKKRTI